jgi:GcrA cell cycle regulator
MARPLNIWKELPHLFDQLKKLAAEGFSFGKIADALGHGLSRSAIAGKMSRSKIKHPKWKRNQPEIVQKARDRVRHKVDQFHPISTYIEVEQLAPPQSDTDIPVIQRKTLMQLEAYHCRYPVGEVGAPDFFFCGDTKIDGSSYCQHHTDRCWAQPVRKPVQFGRRF